MRTFFTCYSACAKVQYLLKIKTMLSQIKRLYLFVTCTLAISLLAGCGGVTNEPVPKALLAEMSYSVLIKSRPSIWIPPLPTVTTKRLGLMPFMNRP